MSENSSCFNGILRRLLCTGNVPTHPSDYISETNQTLLATSLKTPNQEDKIQALASSSPTVTPGIVARLMGLDTLPETNWVRAPDFVKRSKSLGFADYLMDFDLTPTRSSQHRRVRTSVSFREVPAVLGQQQGSESEFLVVYLDSVDKGKEFRSKVMKKTEEVEQRSKKNRKTSEVVKKKGEEKVVKKKSKKTLKLKDEPRRECGAEFATARRNCKGGEGLGYSGRPLKKAVVSSKNDGANLKEGSGENSPVKKTTAQKKKRVAVEPKFKTPSHQNAARKKETAEFNLCSENSSPVSVFDIQDILIQHETWLSEYSSPMDLNSPTKVSYKEAPEVKAIEASEECGDYNELLASKIFKLTEEELRDSNWASNGAVEYDRLEEICVEFEGLILDALLKQAIDDCCAVAFLSLEMK